MSRPYSFDQRGKAPHNSSSGPLAAKFRSTNSHLPSSTSSVGKSLWAASGTPIDAFKSCSAAPSSSSSSRFQPSLTRKTPQSLESSKSSHRSDKKLLPRSNSSDLSITYTSAHSLPKLPKFTFLSRKKSTSLGPQEKTPTAGSSSHNFNSKLTEDEEVPVNSPPPQKTRQIRRKKGAAVSTEPTKTKRSGQAGGSGQTDGTIGTAEDASEEDTEEEDCPLSLLHRSPLVNPANLYQSSLKNSSASAGQPYTHSLTRHNLDQHIHSDRAEEKNSDELRDTSSLSSLPSENEEVDLVPEQIMKAPSTDLDMPLGAEKRAEDHPQNSPKSNSRSSSPIAQDSQLIDQGHYSPELAGNRELDEPSELGEDVCLEYTDFGNDMGAPITWSESEYDDGYQTDQSNEFAEFLLMENSDGSNPFDINRSRGSRSQLSMAQLEHCGSDDSSDNYSQMAYMIIEELESRAVTEAEQETEQQNDDSMTEEDGEDGATTDSLDEDDHSGLARFGIEVDDDEGDDSAFYDLPADSALGSLLTNFELSGDVEFFVLPDQKAIKDDFSVPGSQSCSRDQSVCAEGSAARTGDSKLPVMGSFSVDRQDGRSAGRTIIDEKIPMPPSPFTGGKVVRYNQFKKLQSRSCAGDSMSSSMGTPRQDSHAVDGSQAEQQIDPNVPGGDFDITAFIRGISSLEDDCSETEQAQEEPKLDDLSRWRRVPMTAFRRKMLAQTTPKGDPMALDAAIQSCSLLGDTLSLYEPVGLKKQNARLLFTSPSAKTHRRGHRPLRKSEALLGSSGKKKMKGCEINSGKEDISWSKRTSECTGTDAEEGSSNIQTFENTLFDGFIETSSRDVPMLNLMDEIEGLPME